MNGKDLNLEFEKLSKFMSIYCQILGEKAKYSAKYEHFRYNLPNLSDFDKLNKPLSRDSFDIISINKGTHLECTRKYYNYYMSYKYYIN